MTITFSSAVPGAHQSAELGLLQRWQTPRGAMRMAALHLVLGFSFLTLVRFFNGSPLVRLGGGEVFVFAAASAMLALSTHVFLRYFPRDYRLVGALFALLVPAWAWMAAAGLVISVTPSWAIQMGERKSHVLSLWVGACFLYHLLVLGFLIFEDARLTAINPERALRRASEIVTPDSGLLDDWTWKKLSLFTFTESLTWIVIVPIGVAVLLGIALQPEVSQALSQRLQRALPGHSVAWLVALIFFSHSGLVAVRNVPWLRRSLSAVTTLLVADHLVTATLIGFLATWINAGIDTGFYFVLAVFTTASIVATSLALYRRADLVATARAADATQRAAVQAAEKARAVAELSALQSQIEPHFLYNTLTNLQLLIRQEAPSPSRADAMAGHLIDYLRARLPLMRTPLATLKQELELVQNYLAIIAVRMGPRLTYTVDVPSALKEVQLPPLVIATLVENAVKHGLEPKRGGGGVTITAVQVGEQVEICVADTGVGFSPGAAGTGVGLANIKERLRLGFGDAGHLSLRENTPSGVIATLTLPHTLTSNAPS